jgi:hypothetical protein
MQPLSLCLLCVLLASCGGSDEPDSAGGDADERPVRAVVERLYAAAAEADGARACRLVVPALRRRLDRPPDPCAAEVLARMLGPGSPRNLRVTRVTIDGSGARVVATDVRGHGAAERTYRTRLVLERSGGRWLVASAKEL